MTDVLDLNRHTPAELLLAGKQLAVKRDIWDPKSVGEIVAKILDMFGLDIPNWEDALANWEALKDAFEGSYTGDDFALNAIQNVVGTLRRLATGLINPGRLPLIPFSHIGEAYPNLLENGGFESADSLDGQDIWTWDGAEGRTAPGAARTTGDGNRKVLLSNSVPATAEQKFQISGWVKWTGLTGGANALRVSVIPYIGDTAQAEVPIAARNSPSASSGWTELTGTYEVPTGVDSIRLQVEVGATTTAGTVWWDDMRISKYGSLPQRFIGGLVDALGDLGEGIVAVVNNVGEFFDKITGRIGSTVSDIQEWISQLGTILGGGTVGAGLLPTLSNGLRGVVGGIQDFAQNILDAIIRAIRGVPFVGGSLANLIEEVTGLRTTADVASATALTADLKAEDLAANVRDGAENTGTAAGTGPIAQAFEAVRGLRRRADEAQEAAVVAQQQLQELLASNEAGASGGRSGTDTINRPDSNTLGPLWISNNIGGGQLSIVNNAIELTYSNVEEPARGYALWDGEAPVSDYFANTIVLKSGFSSSFGGGDPYLYLLNRWDGLWVGNSASNLMPNNAIMTRISRSGGLAVYIVLNGVPGNPVATSDVEDPRAGDVIQFRPGSLANERQFSLLYNGRTVAGHTDNADLSKMGPTFRRHGVAMYGEGVPFVGWKRPSPISSYSWSDIPGGGIVLGNAFRYSRVAAASVNQPVNARIPANFFDTQVMSEDIKPPDGTTYDYARGEFVVTKEGWWQFELMYTGTTVVIDSSSSSLLRPVLFHGQGTVGNSSIPMSTTVRVNPDQDDPDTFGDQGKQALSITQAMGSVMRYCTVGERVAPGWGATGPASLVGVADGYGTSFSGRLLS
ncbi:minor tail protein [Gordonia phage Buggaboo]|uniref:Minor tail protein n=1 Tax=Gordonia phage Buggaboo TaxID=2315529 RepID=A0A386KDD7_9CAUD|nr:minor tail protein [Gordonia phage Buggaboo]AVE00701.1 minor tail protein [Gordonia phage SuperSulley]AYD83236.1 minor tail protein [Gordonia phage Buggaboo]